MYLFFANPDTEREGERDIYIYTYTVIYKPYVHRKHMCAFMHYLSIFVCKLFTYIFIYFVFHQAAQQESALHQFQRSGKYVFKQFQPYVNLVLDRSKAFADFATQNLPMPC